MFKVFTDEYIAYILTFKKDFERMRRFLISIFLIIFYKIFLTYMYIYSREKEYFLSFLIQQKDRDILRLRRCKRKILELLEVYFR